MLSLFGMGTNFIVLDRDGTLIKLIPHLSDINLVKLLPDVVDGLHVMKKLGYRFGVITNQSVIGRGLATSFQVEQINNKIANLLSKHNLLLEFFYVCPHLEVDNCSCRKPQPLLGEKAIKLFDINVNLSFYIGDSLSDVKFGKHLGLQTIQISTDDKLHNINNAVATSLVEAALIIEEKLKLSC